MNNPFPDRTELVKPSYQESLIEQAKNIDVEKINFDGSDFAPRTEIKERQKVYFWIRVYLNEETDIQPDTDITLTYVESGEQLETKFICYAKKGIQKDIDETIINYNPEDDRKVLCLMIDSDRINKNSEDIPFIRTLFRIGRFYHPQILRHSDLTVSKGSEILNYYDIDF